MHEGATAGHDVCCGSARPVGPESRVPLGSQRCPNIATPHRMTAHLRTSVLSETTASQVRTERRAVLIAVYPSSTLLVCETLHLITFDLRSFANDGQCRRLSGSGYAVHPHDLLARSVLPGQFAMLPLHLFDVTDRKLAEDALRTTEKLAAVGRLATSIAHEMNNPLEAVTNLLYLARSSTDMEGVQSYLEVAEQELRRVSAISSQTLRFHKQSTNPTSVTCDELIGSTLSIYQGRFTNSQIVVEKRKRCTKPVLCFEGEVRQVLSNLVSNAIDAMHRNGGRLLLRSRAGHEWSSGRAGLIITVADTGSGMGPTTLKKIFDAFFTTKGMAGRG